MDVEMSLIIDYNFQLMTDLEIRNCLTPNYLAQRLWNNFIWKGYIHPEMKYPPLNSDDLFKVKAHFDKHIHNARNEGKKHPDMCIKAKGQFKKAAYLSLSKDTISGVFKRFKLDFELFDFEKEERELRESLMS